MAGSVNKVILVGNLGRDPEIRTSQDGGRIVTFSIATSEHWKDRNTGERREKTEWHRVVIFNPNLADVAERFLKKGSSVYVEGSLQTRKYNDQQGVERTTVEVVIGRFRGDLTLLGGRGEGGGGGDYASPREDSQQQPAPRSNAPAARSAPPQNDRPGAGWEPPSQDFDDDIPF